MASANEIQKTIENIESVHKNKMFKVLNETTVGIGAALRILYKHGGSITSGYLCDLLGVSTARVAVLLKTMVSKGLITKEKNVLDARITVVSLTTFGKEVTQKMQEHVNKQINRVIDHVGFERLEQFFAISKEIEEVLEPPQILF